MLKEVCMLVICVVLMAALCWQSFATDAAKATFPKAVAVWQAGIYQRFMATDAPNKAAVTPLEATVCQNEMAAFQLAAACAVETADLRASGSALSSGTNTIPATAWTVRFADYVLTEEKGLVADPLTEEPTRTLTANRIQPIWLALQVPKGTPAGRYTGEVTVRYGTEGVTAFPVSITVLDATLPDPTDGNFYLDLWQHPGAIARYHQVELWSEPHWALVRAYTQLLATAGQNPITACIIHDPWASQTLDPHPTMVEWIRKADGSFTFDFSIFDRYVALCLEEGLTGPINCYSLAMGPGQRMDCPIRYWDAEAQRYQQLDATVGDATWVACWEQFFAEFIPHLKAKGWFENTCIAMDEAEEKKMQAVITAIPAAFRMALAGNYHEEIDERIYDYCVFYPGADKEIQRTRNARDQITTFYTCCVPEFPNNFPFSPNVESRLLGWIALQGELDGYLRWAFASWPEKPLADTRWGEWPSGDTFLVYPGPRTSLRFELLKIGIQDFEAFKLAAAKAPKSNALADALQQANAEHDGRKFDPAELDAAREVVNQVLAE